MLEELRVKLGVPVDGYDEANTVPGDTEDYGYRSTLTTVASSLDSQYDHSEIQAAASSRWPAPGGPGSAAGGRPPVPRHGRSPGGSTDDPGGTTGGSFLRQDSVEMPRRRDTSPPPVVNVLTIDDHQFDSAKYNSSYHDYQDRKNTEARQDTQVENSNCSSSYHYQKSQNKPSTQDRENRSNSRSSYHYRDRKKREARQDTQERQTTEVENSNCSSSYQYQKSQNRQKTTHDRRNRRNSQSQVENINSSSSSSKYRHCQGRKNTHKRRISRERQNSNSCLDYQDSMAQSDDANDGYDEVDDGARRRGEQTSSVRRHALKVQSQSSATTRRHRREYRRDDGLSTELEQSFTDPSPDSAGSTTDNPLDPAAERDYPALDRTRTLSRGGGSVENGDVVIRQHSVMSVSSSSYRDPPEHEDVITDAVDGQRDAAAAAADDDDYVEDEADGYGAYSGSSNAQLLDTLSEYQQRLEKTNFSDEQPEQLAADDDDDHTDARPGWTVTGRPTALCRSDDDDHTRSPRPGWSPSRRRPSADDSDDDDDTVSSAGRRVMAVPDQPQSSSAAAAATPGGAEPSTAAESPSDSIDVSELEEDEYLE